MSKLNCDGGPEHDWPEGFYSGLKCKVCGVRGFTHPKRAPAYCWPHYQAAVRDLAGRKAKFEAAMVAEYGPRDPASTTPTETGVSAITAGAGR